MPQRVLNRYDSAANWKQYNPVLGKGEHGYESDTEQYKVGDGVSAWSQLPYRGLPAVQQTGNSKIQVMSQEAVTVELGKRDNKIVQLEQNAIPFVGKSMQYLLPIREISLYPLYQGGVKVYPKYFFNREPSGGSVRSNITLTVVDKDGIELYDIAARTWTTSGFPQDQFDGVIESELFFNKPSDPKHGITVGRIFVDANIEKYGIEQGYGFYNVDNTKNITIKESSLLPLSGDIGNSDGVGITQKYIANNVYPPINASDTPFTEVLDSNNAMKGIIDIELYASDYPKYDKFALLYLWKKSTSYSGQWCIRLTGWDSAINNWAVIGTWLQSSYTPIANIERIKIENAGYVTVDWRLIPDGTSITSGCIIKKKCYKFKPAEYALGENKGGDVPSWVYQAVTSANITCPNMLDFNTKQITLSYLWRSIGENKTNLIRFGWYNDSGVYNDNYFAYEWRGDIPNQKTVYQLKNGEIYIEIDWSKIDVGASWNGRVVVKNILFDNSEGASESYSVRDTTMQTVTVKKDGTGNYSSLQDAYTAIKDASFANQYEICVYPGVYEENNLIPPPFTHTHGLAPNSVIVTSKHLLGTTTLPVFDQRNGSSKLSNMLIESGTGYCIHYDVNLHKSSLVNENLHLRKLHYEGAMMAIIGGGSFKGGTLYHWKGCTFENGSAPCHTNANALNENTRLIFECCNFINAYPDLGSVGGFGHCICELVNCTFHLGSRGLNGWISKMRNIDDPTLYLYNNVEWQVIGGGNKNFAPMLFSSGKTIMIEADNNISISGSAADILFSKIPNIVNKVGVSKATLTSLYYIADEQSGLPPSTAAADVVQMWKRLGDCSIVNKTLTVTVGGVVKTHTFTDNYLSTKESQVSILSKIQSSLSNCVIKSVEDGTYFYDNINTSEKIYIKALTSLSKGDFITINGNKATSNTNEPIAGIVCKSCVTGDYAQVWTSAFRFDAQLEQGYYSLGTQGELVKSDTSKIGYVKNYIFYPTY